MVGAYKGGLPSNTYKVKKEMGKAGKGFLLSDIGNGRWIEEGGGLQGRGDGGIARYIYITPRGEGPARSHGQSSFCSLSHVAHRYIRSEERRVGKECRN